jgi:hypothetical protein
LRVRTASIGRGRRRRRHSGRPASDHPKLSAFRDSCPAAAAGSQATTSSSFAAMGGRWDPSIRHDRRS